MKKRTKIVNNKFIQIDTTDNIILSIDETIIV